MDEVAKTKAGKENVSKDKTEGSKEKKKPKERKQEDGNDLDMDSIGPVR